MGEFHRIGDKDGRLFAVNDNEGYEKLLKTFSVRKITEHPKKYPAVVFVSQHDEKKDNAHVRVDIIGVSTLISDLKKLEFVKLNEGTTVTQEKTIQSRVIQCVNETLGTTLTEEVINLTLSTVADFDSLDMIEIVMALEDEFFIDIPDSPLTDKGEDISLADIIKHVEDQVNKNA